MNRKDFIRRSAGLLLLAAPMYALSSCSSSDDSDISETPDTGGSTSGNCLTNGTKLGTISSNHGHNITIPKADVVAGIEKSYDITGSSSHPHSITVTVANFEKLKKNEQISITSSTDNGHSHGVSVSCA